MSDRWGTVQTIFGKNNVLAFKYQGDVVQQTIQKLGIATPNDNSYPRYNQSLNTASIALLRTLNRYNIKAKDKERLMPYLREINNIIENYAEETLIDVISRARVLQMVNTIKF